MPFGEFVLQKHVFILFTFDVKIITLNELCIFHNYIIMIYGIMIKFMFTIVMCFAVK